MGAMTPDPPARATGPTISWAQGRIVWQSSLSEGLRRGRHAVMFRGKSVVITMVANAPGHPDMSFEAGGLTDPTVYVPLGAHVALRVINMDYGPDMDHGLVITAAKPPYPARLARRLPGVLADIPPLPPRSNVHLRTSRYAEATVRFVARRAGTYYYVCPVPGHALAFRMYGRFVVGGTGIKPPPRS